MIMTTMIIIMTTTTTTIIIIIITIISIIKINLPTNQHVTISRDITDDQK